MSDSSPATLFRFPQRAWLGVRGEDRVRFLHAMLTNEVALLEPGQGNRSLLLSAKGKLLADLTLLACEEEVLLGTDTATIDAVESVLDGYVVADDVSFARRKWKTIAVVGEGAAAHLAPRVGPTPAADHEHRTLADGAVLLRRPWTWQPSFELAGPDAIVDAHAAALAAGGVPVGSEQGAEVLRVEAGEPAWGRELTEDVIPLEARLDATLHRTKGCYLGQETIVRVLARGHVNWLLRGLRLGEGSLPAPGTEVLGPDGKQVGRVTSAVRSERLGEGIALARLRREVATAGTRLRLTGSEREVAVADLPFVGQRSGD